LGDVPAVGLAFLMPRVPSGLQDLATVRSELGMVQGEGTLARLEIGGQRFYGINAHGQPVNLRVNPISATHAETDVLQQAANAGASSTRATLTVDRSLCAGCGRSRAVKSMARQLGVQELEIVTPDGVVVVPTR
jgi:hypothetical protein